MPLILNKLVTSLFRLNLTPKVIPVKFIHDTDIGQNNEGVPISKDRTTIIPVEISIKYLKSSDEITKVKFPHRKHEERALSGVISTGSPCPICRDEYLILDYRNIDLIKQFISEHDGRILNYNYTGLCQKAYKDLRVAVTKAKEYGLLTYDVPFRYYDYSEWKN
ncbi:28S ribosomal protein S18b, mitochondrial [Melipona quadrifasciata]|uniref:Small ribosomal subunit protein mS40 n=1 Tax=Melipona quadrifasciata TaxID=166423 RepID=A0A0M9A7C9_9HYME|nr:28S ribosomal protein S18b, mitochondrial [Melipona quadrifasciata]